MTEVSNLEQAEELLMSPHWPGEGPAYDAAVIAIVERAAPDAAGMEDAFRDAAAEAGILRE